MSNLRLVILVLVGLLTYWPTPAAGRIKFRIPVVIPILSNSNSESYSNYNHNPPRSNSDSGSYGYGNSGQSPSPPRVTSREDMIAWGCVLGAFLSIAIGLPTLFYCINRWKMKKRSNTGADPSSEAELAQKLRIQNEDGEAEPSKRFGLREAMFSQKRIAGPH